MYVPYQLERLLLFGFLTCIVSLTSVLVVLPLRAAFEWFSCAMQALRANRVDQVPVSFTDANRAHTHTHTTSPLQEPRLLGMRGPQLYDGLCLVITGCAAWALVEFHTGTLYFWLKDLTNEFLKLQVIFTALEIADKVCVASKSKHVQLAFMYLSCHQALCNFGVDAFEALLGTCCAVVAHPTRAWKALTADVVVAALTVYGHCTSGWQARSAW